MEEDNLVEAVQRTADCACRSVAEWEIEEGDRNAVVAEQEEGEEEEIPQGSAHR